MKALFYEEWAQSIKISGMDPQPTYPLISEYMIDWLKNHTDNEFYELIKAMEKRFFELDSEMMLKITKPLKEKIKYAIQEYENLFNIIELKLETCTTLEMQRMFQLIRQGMKNRLKWLKVNLKGIYLQVLSEDLICLKT